MGAKTKTVGGGTATPVANEFNNFLLSQLTGGAGPSMGQRNALGMLDNMAGKGGAYENVARQLQNQINQSVSNGQQPQQQTSQFQNAFQSALGGNVNDMSGANAAMQGFFGSMNRPQGQQYSGLQSNQDFMANVDPNDPRINTPEFQQYMAGRANAVAGQAPQGQQGSQFNIPTNFANQFNAPQFQAAQLNQLPTNFGAGQTGMANLSQFGNAAQSNSQFGPIASQFGNALQGLMQQGSNQLQNGGGFNAAQNGAAVNMTPQMSFGQALDTLGNDPYKETLLKRAIAENNARFGAEGAGALGTGAQYSNALLQSDFAAQDASMRRAQAMQLMGQDLAGNSALANVGLQNRGQDIQTAIANMQGGLQGNQNQTALMNQLLGAAGQARGQDINAGLTQQQLGSQQGMFNAGQQNDMQTNLMQAFLQNQNLGNQFGVNAQQLNNSAMQNNNVNSLNNTQFQNQFNQNNASNTAQFGQAANSLNSNNMAQNNQMFQNMIGQGLNLNQLGNQNMMQMLGQLFNGFGQTNTLGTPQAQIIQQPSAAGQLLNAGLGIAGSYLTGGGGFGGLFGGGVPQMPNVNVPIVNNPFPRPQLFGG